MSHRTSISGILGLAAACLALLCAGCEEIAYPGEETPTWLDGDVRITTAGDLEVFAGITEVRGDVTIGAFSGKCLPIENLKPMRSLTAIRGRLTLRDIDGLVDLDDLAALEVIGGGLHVNECVSLRSVRALSDVVMEVGVELISNPVLENVDGLETVTSLSNGLIIDGNAMLTNLRGLRNLASVGTDAGRTNVVAIIDNPLLGDEAALSFANNLQVFGDILVSGNSINP